MRLWAIILAAIFLTTSVVAAVPNDVYGKSFNDFVARFRKQYTTDEERDMRFDRFKATYFFVAEENAKGNSYNVALNQFSDMTPQEFVQSQMGLGNPSDLEQMGGLPFLGAHEHSNAPLPRSVDWVSKGAVSDVKNQAGCGSCWAYSSTGALEGAWQIQTGSLLTLSEQQFVDCDGGNHGCSGGWMEFAFMYAGSSNICTDSSYPYTAGGGQHGWCQETRCNIGIPRLGVRGFKTVPRDDGLTMMAAVAQQPVSIGVAVDRALMMYFDGIMSGTCGAILGYHAILVVGYGREKGMDYWLVKNSWGNRWGLGGYAKTIRGENGEGRCKWLSWVYPVVNASPVPTPEPPTPPPPTPLHYGKPPCQSDEVDVQLHGVSGTVCAPNCFYSSCPTDVPTGTTAQPGCVLQDTGGYKYCGLECNKNGMCPAGAKCTSPVMGICIYPDSESKPEVEVNVVGAAQQAEVSV